MTTDTTATTGPAEADTVLVKVSAVLARQRFHGCTPDYIRQVCHGACCRSTTSPTGTLITIHPSEQAAVEVAGGTVRDNLLVSANKRCPFQQDGLCGLHGDEAKPFGCIASPFTLNRGGTLVVRNRYRRLRCYRDDRDGPAPPAYRAFRASLNLIFGPAVAQQLVDHLDAGGGDIRLPARADAYRKLIDNDQIKHAMTSAPQASPREPTGSTSAVVHDLTTTREPVASLRTYHRNPRQGDVTAIRQSLMANGQYRPLVANRGTHTGREREVLAGNHTLKAARDAGWGEVAVSWVDVDDDQAARIVAADNRTADLGGYDERLLAELLGELPDLTGTGYTEDDLDRLVRDLSSDNGGEDTTTADDEPRPTLADRFLVPPFSVLDARLGWWQDRKRAWLSSGLSGIESHTGRDAHLIYRSNSASPNYYEQKTATERRLGRMLTNAEFEADHFQPRNEAVTAGTSVFDPVLAEIIYRWFCPPGGQVLDPWAGGSVRGLVAAVLGLRYTGIELRAEQITANETQVPPVLGAEPAIRPRWLEGDCLDLLPTMDTDSVDLIFGCPPYFDLERYSDDPRDLSTMTTEQFSNSYRRMIALAAERLRPDRYAVLVVGSARDRRSGMLRDLRGLTVEAAHAAGLGLHNEAVLVTMIGSLPHRAARIFTGTRVLGRSHQDVLVFVKGDRKRATEAAGEVDITNAVAALGADADQ
ncbi:hypothetical protein [Actinophytocola sediminis]